MKDMVESTLHILCYCPVYEESRQQLFDGLSEIPNVEIGGLSSLWAIATGSFKKKSHPTWR